MESISVVMAFITLAFVVESVAEVILNIIDGKLTRKNITPIVVAMVIAWGFQIDLLVVISKLLEIPYTLPYAGIIITALFFSRGSEWAHNFWVKFQVFLNPNDKEFQAKKK